MFHNITLYSEYANQEDVFVNVAPLIEDLVENGFNCSILAYGQTGTGLPLLSITSLHI